MFDNSGTWWHCVCDTCGASLYDQLGICHANMHKAIATANAFDWQVNVDAVTCNVCRIISAAP